MKFVAFDGKTFNDLKECQDYETKLNTSKKKEAEKKEEELKYEKKRLERLQAIKEQAIKLDILVSEYAKSYPEHIDDLSNIMDLGWPYDEDEEEDDEDEDECCCGCCEDIDDCIVESAIELVCAFDKLKALIDYCCE